MKSFQVTEIVTTADGCVRLNGPKGSIEIRRSGDSSVAQLWRKDTIIVEHGVADHFLRVDEIPLSRSAIGGGSSFRNIVF